MSHPLRPFLDAARAQGASDAFVRDLLVNAGWPERRVNEAYLEYYAEKTGVEVPEAHGGGRGEAARDAFWYLLAFATLGAWAGALGSLLFTFINKAYPLAYETGSYYGYQGYSVATELAVIIITFPLYLFIMHLIQRDLRLHPEKRESAIRKWLTYIILFITAGFIIGDLVALLATFFRGDDVSARFLLKVLVVLVIAGSIFTYYLRGLRSDRNRAVS